MNYPGGKGVEGVYHTIINQMPPHSIFIEGFLGGGAILRHKRPAKVTYGIEINRTTFDAWQTNECGSFPAPFAGYDNYHKCDKLARGSLTVFNTDFLKFARNLSNILNKRSTFIYLDPPYVQEVRSGNKRIYDSEFADWFSHEELLSYILTLNCNVMISGYEHPVYDSKLAGWRKLSFQGLSRGGRTVETIWMNYPEPTELHDYSYIGDGYREREAIRKRHKNWIGQLRDMKPLHRRAMLAVLNQTFANDHTPPNPAVSADTAENGGAMVPRRSTRTRSQPPPKTAGLESSVRPGLAANAKTETLITAEDIDNAIARGYDRFHYVQQEWFLTNDSEVASYRVRDHNKKIVEAALKKRLHKGCLRQKGQFCTAECTSIGRVTEHRQVTNVPATTTDAGGAGSDRSAAALSVLVENYFSDHSIATALQHTDPAKVLTSEGRSSLRGSLRAEYSFLTYGAHIDVYLPPIKLTDEPDLSVTIHRVAVESLKARTVSALKAYQLYDQAAKVEADRPTPKKAGFTNECAGVCAT